MTDPTRTDPVSLFAAWYAEARVSDPAFHDAMCLSTVSADGRPAGRMVLLKEFDARGFVFYTNLGSRKARELGAHGFGALTFHWAALQRQVRVEGTAEQVTDAEADAYFATRPRGSQIGAWASKQSTPLESRTELLERVARFEREFEGRAVPRPAFWSGFRIVPDRLEFWQGLPSRLHDRFVFTRATANDPWQAGQLYP